MAYRDLRAVRVKLQVPPLRYAPVGMTNLSSGSNLEICQWSKGWAVCGQGKAHRRSLRYAPVDGMTKLRAVAHLGMRGGGWTDSKKANLDKSDSQPSPSTSSHGTPGQAGQSLRD